MPNFWAFKISRKHWIYHKNKNIRHWMLVFVYSPYHLNLSFPHLVVIPTTLETPKNFLAFSTQIFRLFWIPPKNPHLNQATQKNTCQIFLPKQIPGIENLKPQKIPLIIPVTWNPVYSPPPSGWEWYTKECMGTYNYGWTQPDSTTCNTSTVLYPVVPP